MTFAGIEPADIVDECHNTAEYAAGDEVNECDERGLDETILP